MKKNYIVYNTIILILITIIIVEIFNTFYIDKEVKKVSQNLLLKQNEKQVKVKECKKPLDLIEIKKLMNNYEGIKLKEYDTNTKSTLKLELVLNCSKGELTKMLNEINNKCDACNLSSLYFKITEEDIIQGELTIDNIK